MRSEIVGLIAAMPQESQALLARLNAWERSDIGPLRGYRIQIGGYDCQLVQSGVGVKRAMQATRLLAETAGLRWLVSFGIAGAVRENLQIGDVVVSERNCSLSEPGSLLPLAILSTEARLAATQALIPRGVNLVSGTAITTHGSQLLQANQEELPNPILEMETWGIARVANEKGLLLLSLRAISDGPQAPIPLDLASIYDDEYNLNTGKLVKVALRQPRLLLQARGLMRNMHFAAENAAVVLVAILSQPLPVLSS